MKAFWAAGLLSIAALFAVPVFAQSGAPRNGAAPAAPRPGHVFLIVLENEGYNITFGPNSPAVFLRQLAGRGALLQNYYGIGHNSLGNYIAMVSGQAPNPATQSDCRKYIDFVQTGTADDGQAIGAGCIYPPAMSTLAKQLEDSRLTWKGYMEDMGNDPAREQASCGQPMKDNQDRDRTQHAEKSDQYAARHNPFVYFHSIVDDGANCAAHVVNLSALKSDLANESTAPNYVYITPNLCHDGHDEPCVDGEPGGLVSADKFLRRTVPLIEASPAFQHDGLLIVTFDESDGAYSYNASTGQEIYTGDASACCDELPGPNITPGATVFGVPDKGPGIVGPGGGRIGAVLVSPTIAPGTVSTVPYNHYSLLRSVEDFFGLDHLGYAGQQGLKSFGLDVFTPSHR
jgi:phosphatidylinositol-3-phosphatase